MRIRAAAGAALITFLAAGRSDSSAAVDDQASADAAIAVFNERMTQAGFESTGHPELVDDPADVADDELTACLDGHELVLISLAEPAEGESARAYSDEFDLLPGDGEPETTSGYIDAGEFASAFVLTYDDTHVDRASAFVTLFGSDQTAACFRDAWREQFDMTGVTSPDPELMLPEYQSTIDVANTVDLGVGDLSARVALTFAVDTEDVHVAYVLDLYAASRGRTLVIVFHATFGDVEPTGAVDFVAELAAMVGQLAG